MRVLAFDVGFRLGTGLVQHDGPVSFGTKVVPGDLDNFGGAAHAVRVHAEELVKRHQPDLIMCAEPYVRRYPPATADSLRPIMGFETIIEMVAFEQGVEFREELESKARAYFGISGNRDACKEKAIQFCRDRCWDVLDDDSADALVIAAYGLAIREPDRQHELLPLYQKRKRRLAS